MPQNFQLYSNSFRHVYGEPISVRSQISIYTLCPWFYVIMSALFDVVKHLIETSTTTAQLIMLELLDVKNFN